MCISIRYERTTCSSVRVWQCGYGRRSPPRSMIGHPYASDLGQVLLPTQLRSAPSSLRRGQCHRASSENTRASLEIIIPPSVSHHSGGITSAPLRRPITSALLLWPYKARESDENWPSREVCRIGSVLNPTKLAKTRNMGPLARFVGLGPSTWTQRKGTRPYKARESDEKGLLAELCRIGSVLNPTKLTKTAKTDHPTRFVGLCATRIRQSSRKREACSPSCLVAAEARQSDAQRNGGRQNRDLSCGRIVAAT